MEHPGSVSAPREMVVVHTLLPTMSIKAEENLQRSGLAHRKLSSLEDPPCETSHLTAAKNAHLQLCEAPIKEVLVTSIKCLKFRGVSRIK